METIRNVEINQLHDFKNHLFKVEVNTELCELIKSIEAGVLSSVFKIHDRARGAVYKLCEVFLCPAFRLSLALDLPA